MRKIQFNQEKLDAFRKEISQARTAGQATFQFEGAEVAVSYAEYVAEYVADALKSEQIAGKTEPGPAKGSAG